MKILVTGGAGFIGANFVNHWVREHAEDHVLVLDKLTYAGDLHRLEVSSDKANYEFVEGDICDYELVSKLLDGVEVVIHFAAESHVDRSLSGLEAEKLFYRVNVEGTATLLHASREAGVKRFHHISTDEVFGELEYGSPDKFHEEFPYNPHNPYAISKAAADFAVKGFARSYDFPITISNCTNNYGPYQMPEKMIPRSIALLLRGEKIQLYTDEQGRPGLNVRDWLHVDDHCKAVEAIVLNGQPGETYCIGGNSELSNQQLVEKMLRVLSRILDRELSFEQNVSLVKDRPGHDKRYAMNFGKITRDLDWRPSYSSGQGRLINNRIWWCLSSRR